MNTNVQLLKIDPLPLKISCKVSVSFIVNLLDLLENGIQLSWLISANFIIHTLSLFILFLLVFSFIIKINNRIGWKKKMCKEKVGYLKSVYKKECVKEKTRKEKMCTNEWI